jgi:hypothetical protein
MTALKKLFKTSTEPAEVREPASTPAPVEETPHESTSISTHNLEQMDKKEALHYPIGRFEYGKTYSLAQTREHISIIEHLPNDLKK